METPLERLAKAQPETQKSSTIVVLPFDAAGAPAGEIILPGLYARLRQQDLLGTFFHEAPRLTFGQFVAALSQPNESYYWAVRMTEDGEITEHIGLAYLTQRSGKRALGGFVFFREYWNHHDADAAARAILEYWFNQEELDVVVGITPAENRAALLFIRRLGFTVLGEIPQFTLYEGRPAAGVVSFMERTVWNGGQGRTE